MKSPTQNSVLLTVAILSLGILAGEIWYLQRERQSAERTLRGLAQRKSELDRLTHQSPALSGENEMTVDQEVVAAAATLKESQLALQGNDSNWLVPPTPKRPIDAYFELANLFEKLRNCAKQAQVTLKPDERFGFSTYTNEGPLPEQITAVQRQWLATQLLLEKLLESRPIALLAVRRERPLGLPARDQNRMDDFFDMSPGLSLKRPGLLETEALRVEFTGQTSSLRNFLSNLATSAQPILVRRVDVEPWTVSPAAGGSTLRSADASIPLVSQNLSKFAVTVEFVFLVPSLGSTP